MLQRIIFKDQDVSRFQDNVDKAITPIQSAPLVGGQVLSKVSLISGQDNLIPHSLGYAPTIIFPFVPNVDTRIWSPNTASLSGSNASTKQINLRCSASCTVSIMVK